MEVTRLVSIARRALLLAMVGLLGLLTVLILAWVLYPREVVVDGPFSAEVSSLSALDYYDLGAADIAGRRRVEDAGGRWHRDRRRVVRGPHHSSTTRLPEVRRGLRSPRLRVIF